MGTSCKRLTTVGDLVVAVTDAALEIVKNEKKAYQIAGFVVNEMLDTSFQKPIVDKIGRPKRRNAVERAEKRVRGIFREFSLA